MNPASTPDRHAVLAVVGWSGSGKTTLLETLLPLLQARGLRVNAIKHSHHDIELEPAHKDSARLRRAGAQDVLLASPFRQVLVQEWRGAPEATLAQQLAAMRAADLTLIEGFKQLPLPKLEVHRPAHGKAPLYPQDRRIVAVASDCALPVPPGVQQFDLNRPVQIADWLCHMLERGDFIWQEEQDGIA